MEQISLLLYLMEKYCMNEDNENKVPQSIMQKDSRTNLKFFKTIGIK